MKALITGVAGFVGSFLAEYLLAQKAQVAGLDRSDTDRSRLDLVSDRVRFYSCDMRCYEDVRRIIEEVRPDRVFHLAAQSFVPQSWKKPEDTFTSNVIGQINLLEAIRECGLKPRIHVAGSSEEYGLILEHELPVTEENPLRPLSPYAVSKVTQDLMGYQYFKSYGMAIVRTRAFNHTGPRRHESFVLSNFSKQVALIEAEMQDPVIQVGNLDAVRDFTDVRDMVQAYGLVLEKCEPGEIYNICSGIGRRIGDLLELIIAQSKVKIKIKKDPQRTRPSDLPRVVGQCQKFTQLTGWKPSIPIEKTIRDLLDYWRDRVKSAKTIT